MLPDEYLKKRIIIVGAGVSGIACAEQLREFNFENVKVLEASNRIGGRAYTFAYGNCSGMGQNYIELGVQRLPEDSCLYPLAQNANQIDGSAPDYGNALENFELVYESNERKAISALRVFFSRLLLLPKDFNDILKHKEFVDVFRDCDGNSIRNWMKGVYQWWFGMSYEYVFSKRQAELNSGFSGLLYSMMAHMNMDIFIPEKEVIKIDWTDFRNQNFQNKLGEAPTIKVSCRDESMYEADHVIITVPLGYLKENVEALFIPSLPAKKRIAIELLDFVTVNKIFLEFEDPFWGQSDIFHVIWNKSMDEYFGDHKHESGQDPKEWVKCINRFEYVHSSPKMLCAWIWGEGAAIMEDLPEEEVSCCCRKLLECVTKKLLPMPNTLARSMWKSDRLFRGSVVYDPSRGVRRIVSTLAESVYDLSRTLPVLLFAGDAASPTVQMSTVHGAIESGRCAAENLRKYYESMTTDSVLDFDSGVPAEATNQGVSAQATDSVVPSQETDSAVIGQETILNEYIRQP